MAFLVDTNVISETFRPRPAPQVLGWVRRQTAGDLFLAAMSLGELVRGARRVKDRAQRERLARWINHDLATQFQGRRTLPFDREAAMIWGAIMGDGDRTGRPKPMADAQIAVVALRHGLTLATRNIRDFKNMGVALVDPWAADQ